MLGLHDKFCDYVDKSVLKVTILKYIAKYVAIDKQVLDLLDLIDVNFFHVNLMRVDQARVDLETDGLVIR
jgi:hypothetical protein